MFKKRAREQDNAAYVGRTNLPIAPVAPGGQNDQNHVYLNLSIINGDTSDQANSNPQKCVFSEVRTTPIVADASEWDASVVRFSANGTGRLLPLFIPLVQLEQTDPNLTIYSVSVKSAGGNWIQKYIQFNTSNLQSPLPSPPLLQQDISSQYYYVRTYSEWLVMVNTAISTACGLQTPPIAPPVIYRDSSGLFFIVFPDNTWLSPAATSFLAFNAPMGGLFANFSWQTQPNPVINGAEYVLSPIKNFSPPSWVNSISGAFSFVQDYQSCDDLWSPIDSFVFTTTFLPIASEQGTAPILVGTDNIGQNQGVGNGFSNIITDFIVPQVSGSQDSLGSIIYVPSGEYRMASLLGHQAIQQVDIALWWKYRLTGQLIPLYMANLASVSIKIMFRKKGLTK